MEINKVEDLLREKYSDRLGFLKTFTARTDQPEEIQLTSSVSAFKSLLFCMTFILMFLLQILLQTKVIIHWLQVLKMSVISKLQVSVNKDEEKMLCEQVFKKLFVNLNKGAEEHAIYLWYKEGGDPITRIQLSFNDVMAKGLMEAGFQKIDKNLNAGAGGNNIYLWYYKGSSEYDIPIVNLELTTKAEDEPHMFKEGWKKLSCNLNRQNDGDHIYLWVKKQKTTYICDIDATTGFGEDVKMFNDGYIRVDEDTNRGVGGLYIFIWYRQTTDPKKTITQLGISTYDAEQKQFQDENYVSVIEDLNQKTGGNACSCGTRKTAPSRSRPSLCSLNQKL